MEHTPKHDTQTLQVLKRGLERGEARTEAARPGQGPVVVQVEAGRCGITCAGSGSRAAWISWLGRGSSQEATLGRGEEVPGGKGPAT